MICIRDVSYAHKIETDKFMWIHNMKKGDYLKSAHEPQPIESQFGINHPTLFFSVWNFILGFLYLSFPKMYCEILVKFSYSLKLFDSLHIIILNGLIWLVYLFFLLKNHVQDILFIFYKQKTYCTIYSKTLRGKIYMK